jgi:Uma2 family endonuclease
MSQRTPGAPVTDALERKEQRFTMSYEDFLAYVDEDAHAEWVNGEVTIFMPPNDRHQAVAGFIYTMLVLFVDLFKLGVVRFAPLEMRLEEVPSSREPDVLFVAREHRERLTNERLYGPADLVVELVSPSSVQRDRAEKFSEYERVGVREYWIIDPRPDRQRVDAYYLTDEGRYTPIAPDEQGRYHSHVLQGFWLAADWLWQEPLPEPLRALQSLSPEVRQALRQSLESE